MSDKPDMLRVTVEDGKYTLVQDGDGRQFALRHGEPWRDLVGDGLTLTLGYRIEELERQNTNLRKKLGKAYLSILEEIVDWCELKSSIDENDPEVIELESELDKIHQILLSKKEGGSRTKVNF